MEIEGACVSKNLDETVRLQSKKREDWIREIRGKRVQGIAEGASNAPGLASSSAVSFPGSNECPGTHCSLIMQEEDKRNDAGEKRMAKTERESDRRREMADLLVLPRPAKSVQNGAGFRGKTWTYWACWKGKSGLSATKSVVASTPEPPLPKRKGAEPSVQIIKSWGGRESKWARATP